MQHTIGQEVANEFVDALNAVDTSYRAEFRDLFAANFGMLRAELELLRAELRAELDKRISELRADLDKGLSEVRADMNRLRAEVDSRFIELRSELVMNLASADDVKQLEKRVSALEGRMGAFQEKITGDLKGMKSELVGWMVGLWFGSGVLALLIRAFMG